MRRVENPNATLFYNSYAVKFWFQILTTECILLKKLDYDLWPVTTKNMVETFLFFVTQPDRSDVAFQIGHRQPYREFASNGAHRASSCYVYPDDIRSPCRNANLLKELAMVCCKPIFFETQFIDYLFVF